MYKIALLAIALSFLSPISYSQMKLASPDSKIVVEIQFQEELSFRVSSNDEVLIEEATIGFEVDGTRKLISGFTSSEPIQKTQTEHPPLPLKNKTIDAAYNEITLSGADHFDLQFRAYNDGVAYRIVGKQGTVSEINETAAFTFGDDYLLWTSPIEGYSSSYEVPYEQYRISEFTEKERSYLPLLAASDSGTKILITEADTYDYPHLFLKNGDIDNQLVSDFPPYPLETKLVRDRASEVTKGASYMAKTNTERSFPWRVFVIADNDADLLETELVYLLSRDGNQDDVSWIQPGKVAWDWWNAMNLYGVDFETGLNTATWMHYVDFAAEHGIEYVILDEGWSYSTTDLTKANSELDLPKLMAHAKEKGVGIILWTTWRALDANWEVLDAFKEWGAKGIKVDFMDRMDQWMVNFYEKAARETYDRQLLIDFHGAFKPTGLRKQYPNVISYEGVPGLENCKWADTITPGLNATLPFIRMACGPMDYTPGAMRNFHTEEFVPNFYRPGSQGTRCHQLALFVLYESGLQMLADSPSNYRREPESLAFLADVPTTWDELKVIEAKVGEYLVIARRKGDTWYLGGITNNEPRAFAIDLSFLGSGDYDATLMMDGLNASKFAEDYQRVEKPVRSSAVLNVSMVKGGGFAGKFSPSKG